MITKEIIIMKVYVESKTNKVFFSVTHKGKRFYVYTGIQTTEKFTGMIFPKSDKSAKAKTRRLAELYARCESYVLDHIEEGIDTIKEHLKEMCTGAVKTDKSPFLSFMQAFLETRERQNTRRSYERTYRCIEAYDDKCNFNTIDKDWITGFIKHEMDKGRKANGISNDITHIKAVFRKAIDDGKTKNFPFHSIKLKKEETRKRCLSLEQMRELRDAKLHGKQALYRDFFMLGFYLIGINVSDLLTLKKEDFRNGRISYYRNKTGRLYDIKVEPEAMEIINRYRSRKPQYLLRFFEDAGTFSVDHFTNNLNRTLRRIGPKDQKDRRKATVSPIDKQMSSYYNRHSWATFASEIGISLETIGRALGHSVWEKTVTAVYVKYDNKKIDEANRKVIDYMNG